MLGKLPPPSDFGSSGTYPHIPIAMHQDHGNSPATCYSAIRHGFTSVMMDGSGSRCQDPASYEYNVEVTRRVVEVAHAVGVSVEGELGCLGSLETGMGDQEDGHGRKAFSPDQLLIRPAVDFVEQTRWMLWLLRLAASALGFTSKPTGGNSSYQSD